MANFGVDDAKAWAESSKLPVSSIETQLATGVTNIVFARLRAAMDISGWTNEASTPKLVRTILGMYYIAALYDKHYAQEDEESSYAITLRTLADQNLAGIISGAIEMDDFETPNITSAPSFFPNDESSMSPATLDAPSNGGPAFTMGSIF
jgi:hypothetical protein